MVENSYKNAKVYRLVDLGTGDQYVGHTVETLSRRLQRHKADFNRWKVGKRRFVTSFSILERSNFDIYLVEAYPCSSVEEIKARERYWIESLPCVNKTVPLRSQKERNETEHAREVKRLYNQTHKEQRKLYNQIHRVEKKEYNQRYYEEHKDIIKKQVKEYREANLEKIKEHKNAKSVCDCGGSYSNSSKNRHLATNKHQRWEETRQKETSNQSNESVVAS